MRFAAILLTAIWLNSCSDGGSVSETSARVPLELCARTESVAATRSTTPLTAGRLGIFRLGQAGSMPQAYLYTASAGVWESETPLMLDSGDATVCAWYPFDYFTVTAPEDPKSVPLQARKYDAAHDLTYMASVTNLNARNHRLQVRLSHACSILEFQLTRDSYTGAGTIGTITLSAPGLLASATLDITSGTYSNGTAADVSFNADITVTDANSVTTAVLLPPATLTGPLSVTVTVDGKERTVVLPSAGMERLDAGNAYIIRGTLQEYDIFLQVTSDGTDGTAGGEIVW